MLSPRDGFHGACLRHSSQGVDRGGADPRRRPAAGALAQYDPPLRPGQGRARAEAAIAAPTGAGAGAGRGSGSGNLGGAPDVHGGKAAAHRDALWELLRDDGHDVGARTVRRLVASFRNAEREVTVPLVYAAGQLAQVDFFEVWVEVAGARQKAWLFLMKKGSKILCSVSGVMPAPVSETSSKT